MAPSKIDADTLSPDTVPPSKAAALQNGGEPDDWTHGLKSIWPVALDLAGGSLPCRLEGEVQDLVVLGEIPKAIDGSFYRVMVDPFVPPDPNNVPLDGDGNISVFQFHDGRVSMKTRYVETERYKLERKANKALFGLYRNPFTHHPCVRAAVDSTANTNLVYWGGHLLALKESALPYAVNAQTLETVCYDPFGQIKSKTFTAHPKYDPYKDELVVFGYEAKGLATTDVVTYSITRSGKIINEFWLHQPHPTPGFIHDCAITPNWLILFVWPFEASIERMKRGGHHWAWSNDRGMTFIVVPRDAAKPVAPGWKPNEVRSFGWKTGMAIHTAAAWEDPSSKQIFVESSRVHDNPFPFFPPDTPASDMPEPDTTADYVRWTIDPTQPDRSQLPDPQVIVDVPAEFPRIDERFMTSPYDVVWMNVFVPQHSDGSKNIYHGLNGLAMHRHSTNETTWFYAGDESLVQEPIFVPRTKDAPEGDGWVIALVERTGKASRCDLVVLDTREFEKPVAIVQLPFHMKAQVHGNWIEADTLGGFRSITREVKDFEISGKGALEPL
ncbi:lignostilbene dioxygenase like protein [Zymoseptoria brevis]|uniref:Lignostilbene dioxygenase like protein n=1 Tax=Zymoseptoria brevis TaxID=1047168 RepID=A0A0F4GPN7_9PEZI|nr:lignostilbene dioxygenase like protein [Zymoseptoria brevis]